MFVYSLRVGLIFGDGSVGFYGVSMYVASTCICLYGWMNASVFLDGDG